MERNSEALINKIMDIFSRLDYIRDSDIPNIDLYMDQVTSFMDDHLRYSKRHDDDKILTKTMINNYTKNRLLPPPVKKKYSKEHLFVLIFIYYFKDFLSLHDIQAVLNPLTDRFFHSDPINMEIIYNQIFKLEKEEIEIIKDDIHRMYHLTETSEFFNQEDDSFLQTFSLICILSFDVYVKKHLIEELIDSLGHV